MVNKKDTERWGSTNSIKYSPKDLEKIREMAYQIWEKKGRPQNNDLNNWLEAEKRFRR